MKRPSTSDRFWFTCGAVAGVIGIGAWGIDATRAQQAVVVEADADAADEDKFVIPDGDAGQIGEFIMQLAQTEPEGETQEEQLAYAGKVLGTIRDAADRMLELKPNEEQESQAHQYRLMALQGLSQLGGAEEAEEYSAAVETLMANERAELAKIGWQMFLSDRLSAWPTLDAETKGDVGARLLEAVKSGEPSSLEIGLVTFVAQNLDRVDDEFVTRLLTLTLPIFQESKSPKVQEALAESNLEGMLRRLTLLGKPIEISGTLLSGEEVDWESYAGKVVLVDFWATWCGPCRGEVPNILEQYKAYHDKGFDVLGVSLDDAPEDAQQYIADMKLPWDSLFPANEEERAWNHPLARYYGITGIPTAILVDQKGNVVHMEARGPALREQLQALLGDPVEQPADAESDATGG